MYTYPALPTHSDWHEENQRYLYEAIACLKHAMQQPGTSPFDALSVSSLYPLPTLEKLAAAAALSPFERCLILLCAAMELDASFPAFFQEKTGSPYPTFATACALFPDAHVSAVSPPEPLRHYGLIDIEGGSLTPFRYMRLTEWTLNYLLGIDYPEKVLTGLKKPAADVPHMLVSSHHALVLQLIACWQQQTDHLPPLVLYQEQAYHETIALHLCEETGFFLRLLPFYQCITREKEIQALIHAWNRQALLEEQALMIVCHAEDTLDHNTIPLLRQLTDRVESPVIISSPTPLPLHLDRSLPFSVKKPSFQEQKALWIDMLPNTSPLDENTLEDMIYHFQPAAIDIQAITQKATALPSYAENPVGSLWHSCREHLQPDMGTLGSKISRDAAWDSLVIPDTTREVLEDIYHQVLLRRQVFASWNLQSGSHGQGISALFSGGSGTGKTLAASVLASALQLDIYRVDVSGIVSKYIGETEKNLQRIFEVAEKSGAILLFDEADALFGKRSEVKDSHDRHANIEVSYLLQRIESYTGLAILTTNLKEAFDIAFTRRLRFIVDFPFPTHQERQQIWHQHLYRSHAPVGNIDIGKLAQLNVAGGQIYNIVLNGFFLAAEEQVPLSMQHLLLSARKEYGKRNKQLTDTELRGWAAGTTLVMEPC